MQLEKLTIKAQEALKEAQEIARRNSNQEVDAEHLVAEVGRLPVGAFRGGPG
jgi:ATP-dependent Clp protease ATP-binding subunit ClpA